MNYQDELRKRCEKFRAELKLPISSFVANVGIERSTYSKWQKHIFDLADHRCDKIDAYLKRFGF